MIKFSEESKRDEERTVREEDKNILEKRIQYGLRKKETISLAEKFSEFNPSGKYEVKFNGDKFYVVVLFRVKYSGIIVVN